MRKIFQFLMMSILGLGCSLAQACPNFSGRYSNSDSGAVIIWTVIQQGCETIALKAQTDYGPISNKAYIDGKRHIYQDDEDFFNAYTASWDGDRVSYISETEFRGGPLDTEIAKGYDYLTPEGNWVDEYDATDQDGKTKHVKQVYIKL